MKPKLFGFFRQQTKQPGASLVDVLVEGHEKLEFKCPAGNVTAQDQGRKHLKKDSGAFWDLPTNQAWKFIFPSGVNDLQTSLVSPSQAVNS